MAWQSLGHAIDLSVGMKAGQELGARSGRRGGGVTWQQDRTGQWIRRLEAAAAARSEATSRGAEARPATSLKGTNPIKGSQNQQQLHRELLFTHRKGLSLHSKPELLQVLEHRNRRQEITEGISEQSPLEQELLRWQQRREQTQQQEATGDTAGNQPEFIRVRENLRKMEPSQDCPQRAAPSPTSSPFLRSRLTKRQPLRATATHPSLASRAKPLQLQASSEGLPLSLAPSQRSLGST